MTTTALPRERIMPRFGSSIRQHPVMTYLALAFLISWLGVVMVVGPRGFPGSRAEVDTLLAWAVLAMLAGPAIAGILLNRFFDGKSGIRDLRSRLLRWRVGGRWYVVALFTAPLTAIAVLLVMSLLSSEFRPFILTAPNRTYQLAFGFAVALAAGVFEELGWTGFATPRLRRRYGTVPTGLLLGFAWGAWHLLVNVWAVGTGFTGAVPAPIFLVAQLFTTLLVFRVLMVWVYDRTHSLLIAILMHASLTATVRLLNPSATGMSLLTYDVLMAAALWIVVAMALMTTDLPRDEAPNSPPESEHATSSVPKSSTSLLTHPTIEGHVSPGFESVRDAFAENFSHRHELGGACCAYYKGEKVVDLWGGLRNKDTGDPWQMHTMVLVYSATKGLAAMTLAVAHSRGMLDYDERVSTYWPEFAQHGKESITVRQLLAHQAGLFAFDEPVDRSAVADPDRLAAIMARQTPAWTPGTRQAYHAISLGFYESELLRRIDPLHRSLGQFFEDEIAAPLGLDFYIRLPEWIPNSRLATLAKPKPLAMLLGFPLRLTLASLDRRSCIYRALITNPGSEIVHDSQRVYARNLEVPSGGGVGTARAMARAYSEFATGGRELGLRADTLRELSAPAIPATHGFYDEGLKGEVRFSLGFMKPSPALSFGGASSFGSPGAGGSLGFADPEAGIGYAYVTSQMGTNLTGDPRDLALREALYSVLRANEDNDPWPARSEAFTEEVETLANAL